MISTVPLFRWAAESQDSNGCLGAGFHLPEPREGVGASEKALYATQPKKEGPVVGTLLYITHFLRFTKP